MQNSRGQGQILAGCTSTHCHKGAVVGHLMKCTISSYLRPKTLGPGTVAHTCNPTYTGGLGRKFKV
jgi:hypothetical protein